ncbi:MAG: DUF922 domain-containing protein [Chitinophagaceae bacterium]|nr:DUF922 domain-containing protein [Chitinophagaceae bacterium]
MPLNNFDRILTWQDFNQQLGQPGGANEYAQIHPDIAPSNFVLARVRNALTITDVTIDLSLIADDCWVVTSRMTNDLLKHEQGHYDILAISAREFYNTLIGLSAATADALQRRVNQLKERFAQQVTQVDARYDSESQTNHGINTAIQQTWDQKIAAAKANPRGRLTDLP